MFSGNTRLVGGVQCSRYSSRMNSIRAFAILAVFFAIVVMSPRITLATQDDPRLDALFARLLEATDPQEVSLLQGSIWSIWTDSGDTELNLKMREGMFAMHIGNMARAIEVFTTIIESAPEFAEGWNKRATARYLARKYEASIADCMVVLELEPRHFGALSGLGLIHIALGENATALQWFRKALEQNPHLDNIRLEIEKLVIEIEGQEI